MVDANPLIGIAANLLGNTELGKAIEEALTIGGYQINGKKLGDMLEAAKTADTALYDLTIPGALLVNQMTRVYPSTYYFSYAVDGTISSDDGKARIPTDEMVPVCKLPARIIGSFSGTSASGIPIDESWLPNDGLVNTISATYPFGQAHNDVTGVSAISAAARGTWNIMPTVRGDHGTLIGLGKDAEYMHGFYDPLLTALEKLQ
jgi:hypothetical protein